MEGGKLICEFSMSLDGYIAGPGLSMDRPMGEGGEALHEWMFGDAPGPDNERAKREMRERTGAVILGRRTCDLGRPHWNGTPFPVPSFVLTHRAAPADAEPGFVFVNEPVNAVGLETALRLARDAAGTRDVRLMGADVTRQYLAAGQVDEIVVQLVPLLLGGGARPFPEGVADRLRQTGCVAAPGATHLRYLLRGNAS